MHDHHPALLGALRSASSPLVAVVTGVAIGLVTAGVGPTIPLGMVEVNGAALLLVVGMVAAGVRWSLRPESLSVTASCLLLLIGCAAVAATVVGTPADTFGAAVTATIVAVVVAAVAGPIGVLRDRRRARRLGWELAQAIADRESVSVDRAVARERSTMAGEIHDQLGHRLTLITIQLSRLSLDANLPEATRQAIESIRSDTADAAADLGETVRLLKSGGESTPVDHPLSEVISQARGSGLEIDAQLPSDLDDTLGPHTRAALERVLREALTNAGKHAPGASVRVRASVSDHQATLQIDNSRVADQVWAAATSGHGLSSLTHRLELLGGTFNAGMQGDDFVVRATVAPDARPSIRSAADQPATVDEEHRAADQRTRRRLTLAVVAPVALAATALVVTTGSMVFFTTGSVLPPERYAQISVGMPQQEATNMLPIVEMLDAPRDALPTPADADCRFYEASMSFFRRDDVYRICFASGVVSDTDVIRG